MTQTYDEILTRMKKRFFEQSGEDPDRSGEILVRLEAVAAEVFALYTFGDFILQQAFAETSTGEYLDKAGAVFSLTRKNAARTTGEVTFTAAEDTQGSITIDQGTAVCAAGAPYIQYFTDETVTIPAANATASVGVTAAQPGTKYNRPAGFIDTVVNPPGGIVRVTNAEALAGGFDEEDDAHFRVRVLDYFREYMNGYNEASIRNACMRMDGVRDCRVRVPDDTTLQIAVRLDGDTSSWQFVLEFLVQFAYLDMFGITLQPLVAEAQSYDLHISLGVSPYSEPDRQNLVQAANEIMLQLSGASRIDEGLALAEIENALLQLDDVEACNVQCTQALAGVLPCPAGKYVSLNTVEEVTLYAV